MEVSLIVAMDQQRGIGKENGLPWRISADLKHFKKLTTGHHILMGRKTFESIGRALPNRVSIVISRNKNYQAAGAIVVQSIGEALSIAQDAGETEAFIIGGGELYNHAMPLAQKLYLTRVHAEIKGIDTYFPPISPQWKVIDSSTFEADEKNEYGYTFETLKKL